MSTQVFPTLAGQGWSVTRTPQFSTRKPQAISGNETVISEWSFGRYTYKLVFNVLRQGKGLYIPNDVWVEFATLFGFYGARLGAADTFLYQDGLDNTVTSQTIGTGDAATQSFQLIRTFGGVVDPIFAPNLSKTLNVYVNGVLKTQGTDYVVVPWGAGNGNITGASATTTSTSHVLTDVVLPSAVNAVQGMVATETDVPFGSTVSQIGPTTLTLNNAASGNTSSLLMLSGSGQLVFASAPGAGLPITADYSYYWPCRFNQDTFDFEQFDAVRVRIKEMSFQTVKS